MKSLALHAYGDAFADFAAHEVEPADYCSREGAEALKAKIEAYWRARGQGVMIALHNVGFHPAIRAVRFDVRSDMVNGLPRQPGQPAPMPRLVEDFDDEDFD